MFIEKIHKFKMTKKFKFPKIPSYKLFNGNSKTPEQLIMEKIMKGGKIEKLDELILKEVIVYYTEVIDYLKTIPLDNIDIEDAKEIISNLRQIFNQNLIVSNDIGFDIVNRVTVIEPLFLEKDCKVHNPKWLIEPTIEVVKKKNLLNRCRTFDQTLFYAAFKPEVAIIERKPEVTKHIIVSTWHNHLNRTYDTYIIPNANVNNDNTTKANKVYKSYISNLHPLVQDLYNLITHFQSQEITKEVSKVNKGGFEYLFSSVFSGDAVYRKAHDPSINNPEMVLYPSVACKHREENIAMVPFAARSLKLIEAVELEVVNTYYEKELDFSKGDKPADLREIRRADTWIQPDNIIWNDD